ncbi:Uncharacterised protein [Staphylococcus gallinarum]|uniref:Uncharacterized protein n=1 Tax=Staphylococcus gallinarum TaxID=1293 RepID=A0A380FAZ4_STAGA|nr:Uncharacterised protein [Staphylococcus gallinarum]
MGTVGKATSHDQSFFEKRGYNKRHHTEDAGTKKQFRIQLFYFVDGVPCIIYRIIQRLEGFY